MAKPSTKKLKNFAVNSQPVPVTYIETMQVKDGVSCDVYTFDTDNSRDLAIVTVDKGFKTPLQKILKGNITTEGFVSGTGSLTVTQADGQVKTYTFSDNNKGEAVEVKGGRTYAMACRWRHCPHFLRDL